MLNSIVRIFLTTCFYVLLIYYLLICIYFIMGWIKPFYNTKIFYFMEKVSRPFMNIVSGKFIVGYLDLGATLGILVYGYLLRVLSNIIMMI